ncbi:MAG TPA: DUF3343 domain-containing protein [Spirochaetota bacterium]|nr:DUF3343 domain-containing protein [Spirochaetota bacterium]
MNEEWCVALFHSTSLALRGERLCREEEIPVKLIPVPRNLGSDCGVCLRFHCADEVRLRAVFAAKSLEFDEIVRL